MEDFNRRISAIRTIMENMKVEMYAISNLETASLDEYTKNLYMRMLCTVIQYENETSEMQILYLRRLHKGIHTDNSVEDYMRQALDISADEVREFINLMANNKARYFFTLESILLMAMGNTEHSCYEYIGELIELLGITKRELEHLVVVARSVMEQNSEYYDEAKKIAPETTVCLVFTPYIENYYAGAIIDTNDQIYYSSPEKDLAQTIKYCTEYKNRYATFNNLPVEISQDWLFEGCENITFKNCVLSTKNAHKLIFKSIGKLTFVDCKFMNFSNHLASMNSVNEIVFHGCVFENCGWTCDGDKRGGVLALENISEMSCFDFCDNSLNQCYIAATTLRYNYGVTGILMWVHNSNYDNPTNYCIKNNEFIGCECKNNGNYTPAIISGINEKMENVISSDNRCTGEVTRLFEA